MTALVNVVRFGDHDLPVPTRKTDLAVGFDVQIAQDVTLYPGDTAQVGTGFGWDMPPHLGAMVIPRSGLGHKEGVVLSNLVGLIDPDYQGEVKANLWNRTEPGQNDPVRLPAGTRVAQIVLVPRIAADLAEVKDFSQVTQRGAGGHGSTGY